MLSGSEICKIINACAKKGVSKLQLGPLLVEFGQQNQTSAPSPVKLAFPENVIQEQEKESKNALEAEEINLREQQIAELQLTDPLKFEEMLESGQLEPGGDQDDGTSAEA